jgi:hypothetical protein
VTVEYGPQKDGETDEYCPKNYSLNAGIHLTSVQRNRRGPSHPLKQHLHSV